jgi:hypothetical protein
MFNLRSVFAFWAILALFLGSEGRAQAQTTGTSTVTIPNTGVRRDHQDFAGKVLVTQINYKDCLTEDFFTFTVNLGSDYAKYALEVFAGTSCDMTAARPPSGTATCWRVADQIQPTTIIVNNLKIPIRRLLEGRTGGSNIGSGGTGGTGGTGGSDATGGTDATVGGGGTGGLDGSSGGTPGTDTPNVPTDAPSECTPTSAAVAPQTLTLYFLLLDSNSVVGGQAQYKVTFKLTAPSPPSNVNAGTGENVAPVTWTPATSSDQTIDGYQLYCDPAPGQSGLDESDVVWDPNVLPVSCPQSSILLEGTRPADKYKCGTANKTSSRANATGLVNMVPYNVSVASTDTYRNVGVISAPACAIPQPVTGFFEAYRNAGGEGGGGFCSFSRHGRPVLLFSVLGLGLCLMLRRRRAT